MREELERKVFKVAAGRLIIVLMQDRHIRDQHSLGKASKETRGNMVRALVKHVDSLHHKHEVRLISSLFSSYDSSKFIGFALSEVFHLTKDIKESLTKKKVYTDSLFKQVETLHKLTYLICVHEASGALKDSHAPQLIQGREHWAELAGHVSSLKSLGVYEHYKMDDAYSHDIQLFQNLVLQNKFDITGRHVQTDPTPVALARA